MMRRSKTILLFVILAVFIIWNILYSTNIKEMNGITLNEKIIMTKEQDGRENFAPLRVVHLDLKGAPPKLSYLKELLPIIAASGGNALLIEYEDMFPYEGILRNISSKIAYSRIQIKEFLSLCQYYGFEVIPLVQTFGHLEFVLKHAEFKHLRENSNSTQEICPSNARSLAVIQEMLMQVLKLHPNAKRVHIGCDEVFSLNVCPRCLNRHMDTRDIFLSHVKTVSKMIKTRYPKITPLIWDDMLRTWPASTIGTSELSDYIEPVIWIYGDNITRLVPLSYWYWYFQHFRNIWIAGAFKGASGEMALIPDTSLHFNNQQAWLKFIIKYPRPNTKIRGYILTGWSRYDHFASLCELLPVATPSLVINLMLITSVSSEHWDITSSYNDILRCKSTNTLKDIIDLRNVEMCSFPGQELIPVMRNLLAYQDKVSSLFETLYERNSWVTIFHLKHKYTNPRKIKIMFNSYKIREFYNHFTEFSKDIRAKLGRYYEEIVIEEWFQEHVALHLHKIHFLMEIFRNYTTSVS